MNIELFLGILMTILLNNLKHKTTSHKDSFLVFLMGFFTTFLHELAHYLFALILGGKPQGLYLIPKKVEYNGVIYWTFGSVKAYTNKFTGFFIGIAPLMWLVAAFFLAKNVGYFEGDFWHMMLFFFLAVIGWWILKEFR